MTIDRASPMPSQVAPQRQPQPSSEPAESVPLAPFALGRQAGDGRSPSAARRVLQLQRIHGNAHVQRLIQRQRGGRLVIQRHAAAGGVLQRVQITFSDAGETLYTGTNPTTNNFQPQSFGGGSPIQYQMTRNDSAQSVTVNVRMKFVSRAPAADGSRDGVDSEIPASDPRRGFATSMCSQLVSYWNDKFVLVGRRRPNAAGGGAASTPASTPGTGGAAPTPAPAPGARPPTAPPPAGPATDPNEVRLRLVFQATPVFDLASTAFDALIAVYGPAQQAGGSGHPIDADHWYMNRGGDYSAPLSSIYAHEYGHLIGLQDEYSRSNHQMHRLMHRFSPNRATRNNQALDTATVSRMVLQAVQPHLERQLAAQGGQISAMFAGQRDRLIPQLATAIRAALRSQTTVDALLARVNEQFQTPGSESLRRTLPRATYFELFDNLSNLQIARDAVTFALSPGGITRLLIAVLREVIRTRSIVTIPNPTAGQPDLNIAVTASAGATSQADMAAPATALATNMMGAPAGGGGSGGGGGAGGAGGGRARPPVYPSGTIMGQLQSLAATWQASGASFGSLIEEGQLRARFLEAATVGIDTNPVSAARSAGGIYQAMYRIVSAAAQAAALQIMRELFAQAIRPTMEAQANQLLAWVEAETQRHTSVAGTGTNASPNTPPDPALLSAVQQMEGRMRQLLQSAQTASATASEEPATSSTDQPVNYTVQGLMGDNNTGASGVRPDMMAGTDTMAGVATQFNRNLKRPDEDDFSARGA